MKWLLKAADLGSGRAENRLGEIYEHGVGAKTDLSRAAEWYRKGAEAGNPAAQYNLAILYIRGAGVEKSPAQMYLWMSLSAEQGFAYAVHDLPGFADSMMSRQDLTEGEQLLAAYRASHPVSAK